MSRIRTVKPELARHRELFELEKSTGFPMRYVWALFPTICDREGRFAWRPWEIKLDIMPYDEVDFEEVMEILNGAKFLRKYEVDGKTYGYIPTFLRHQVINHKEASSKLPSPEDAPLLQSRPSHRIPRPTRELVFRIMPNRCKFCSKDHDLTIDHVIPLSKGGTHEISNLQILCRSCNSSKADRLPEVTAVNSQEVLGTPGHSRVDPGGREGKGRELEKERKGTELPAKPRAVTPDPTLATRRVWNSYREAYVARHKVEPVRNAKTNALVKQLVSRIGEAEAPGVIDFYVRHNDSFYVRNLHALDFAVRDAESLRTQWARGKPITQVEVRNFEKQHQTMSLLESIDKEGI